MIDDKLLHLEETANELRRCRREYEKAKARAVTGLALGTFSGRDLAAGRIWQRVCHDCGTAQSEVNSVNSPCTCGSRVILWEPRAN